MKLFATAKYYITKPQVLEFSQINACQICFAVSKPVRVSAVNRYELFTDVLVNRFDCLKVKVNGAVKILVKPESGHTTVIVTFGKNE